MEDLQNDKKQTSLTNIFIIFLRLGCTSFGGPIAHLAYFREEFVVKRKWLSDQSYSDLIALCQFLPGPASSQVGMALGAMRGGIVGALISWFAFSLPSVLILTLFALYFSEISNAVGSDWIQGLKVVAVAVVAQALWGMGKSLCPDAKRASIAIFSAITILWFPGLYVQLAVILASGLAGKALIDIQIETQKHNSILIPIGNKTGALLLSIFFIGLLLIPVLAITTSHGVITLFDSFYRAGSLVFGGGHVVLPMLQVEVVPTGVISNEQFLAGYGVAQAVPGPLFTFASYVGAASSTFPSGWQGALVATVGIFMPAFLLVLGSLPFWQQLRNRNDMQSVLAGINASVVGILLAAFYNPVWTSGILSPEDFSLALLCFCMLTYWKVPVYWVVLFSAIASSLGWH